MRVPIAAALLLLGASTLPAASAQQPAQAAGTFSFTAPEADATG